MSDAWDTKPLGKIITLQRGFDLPTQSRSDGEIAVIGSNGIVGFHNLAPTNLPVPGLMLGRSGSVGEVTFWHKPYWPLNTVLYVKDFHGNDPRFLSYWLRLFPFKQYAEGVSVPTLNRNSIHDVPFPIPNLDDQLKISAALAAIEVSINCNAKALLTARDLKRAAMRELFTKGLRGEAQKDTEVGPMPESWNAEPLGKHYSAVSGGTPSRATAEFWEGGTIPWVKTTEVNYGLITSTEEHITEAGLQGSAAKWLQAGTLLLAMYGQGVTRGKVAILGIDATCNQACAALRPLDESVDSIFLFHFLSWRYEEIRQLAHGGQQQNLNLDIVRELPIACPPTLEEQNEIVAILDAIDRKIDLHKRKRAVLDELFKTLLHKLMTGEVRVADLDLSALEPVNEAEAAA